eukprot:4847585-Prymnesium_polylepis.1
MCIRDRYPPVRQEGLGPGLVGPPWMGTLLLCCRRLLCCGIDCADMELSIESKQSQVSVQVQQPVGVSGAARRHQLHVPSGWLEHAQRAARDAGDGLQDIQAVSFPWQPSPLHVW